jgi:hypothetical protein
MQNVGIILNYWGNRAWEDIMVNRRSRERTTYVGVFFARHKEFLLQRDLGSEALGKVQFLLALVVE